MRRIPHTTCPQWQAALIALAVLLAAVPAQATPKQSGLPLPRFVSLRADEVNMRAGPGLQYPVEWVFHRRGLPLEVTAEYHVWRRVRDREGETGWIHKAMLSGHRTAIVVGHVQTIRSDREPASAPVAQVEAGVVTRLVECPAAVPACRIAVGDVEGWLDRAALWGIYPTEVVE